MKGDYDRGLNLKTTQTHTIIRESSSQTFKMGKTEDIKTDLNYVCGRIDLWN